MRCSGGARRSAVRYGPQTQRITDQQKEPKMSVRGDMYTEHQSTDDQCALMICVAPAVPPVSVHQCQLSVLIHATCQCPSMPHFSAYQCTSMPHISAHLSCL
ncbi:unnamed protein product [Staurois parvus]|uniref:Uncharacterized protein n=1 Tax=Staurois parvus TaxID=386267 RepID=A0ABN9DP45_9NEOB|nr:unnamed protein product [Staurois parvus]